MFFDGSVERLHQWGFYLLCGIGISSNLSLDALNGCFGALTAVMILRLWRKHDDWHAAIPDGRLGTAFFILVAAAFLSAVFSASMLKSLWRAGDHYIYRALGLYTVLLVIKEKRQLLWIAICAVTSFVINDLIVIYQGLFQGNFRASGFSSYMSVGGFLSMLLPTFVLLVLSGAQNIQQRMVGIFILVIGVAALLFNGTRGAWIAVPTTILFCCGFLIRSKKKFFLGVMISCAVFTAIFAASPSLSSRLASIGDMKMQSNSERILLWTSALHMVEVHPIVGIGYGRFEGEYQERYILPAAKERDLQHAHSNIMHILAECGIIGLFALIFFWVTWIFYSISAWRKTRHIAALLILAILTGLILQGFTEYNMGKSDVMKLHWLLLGLCLQWLRLDGVKIG